MFDHTITIHPGHDTSVCVTLAKRLSHPPHTRNVQKQRENLGNPPPPAHGKNNHWSFFVWISLRCDLRPGGTIRVSIPGNHNLNCDFLEMPMYVWDRKTAKILWFHCESNLWWKINPLVFYIFYWNLWKIHIFKKWN